MCKLTKQTLIKICIFLFGLTYVHHIQAKLITIAADPWPPYIDFSKKSGGFCIEVIQAALATKNYKLDVKNVPWARAMKGVKFGQYDMLPNAWFTKERESDYLFSNPYAFNELKLVIKKGENFNFNGLSSLDKLTLGIINGANYGEEFDKSTNFNKVSTSNMLTNIEMLINDRIDMTLEDELGLVKFIEEQKPSLLKQIDFVEPSFSKKALHIAISHDNPLAKQIIQDFNNGLETIQNNGTYDAILRKYQLPIIH